MRENDNSSQDLADSVGSSAPPPNAGREGAGPALDDDDVVIKPRPKWPLLAFVLLLLGGGGYLAWTAMNTVDPLKVLVAVDFGGQWYEGSKPAARLVDGLNERLQNLGFAPVRAGDPKVVEVLEGNTDLVKAARKLGAAWVVTGRIATEVIEHPIDGGYVEVRAKGVIEVRHVDDEAPHTEEITSWSGSRNLETARNRLSGDALGRPLARAVLAPIVLHPEIQKRLNASADTAGQLQPARQFVAEQGRQVRTFNDAYTALAERRTAAEKGDPKPTLHRPMSAADGLSGTGPKGALVKTADIRPFVSERGAKLGFIEDLETLAWVDAAGKTEVLWSGYNVYGYPGVSDDGRVVALVEDLFGWAKTVTVVVEGGAPQRLRLDPERRFSTLRPSPDGSLVALYESACRDCESELVVLAVADGAERLRLSHGQGRFEGFTWLDKATLLVVNTPPKPEPPPEEGSEEAEGADGGEGDAEGDADAEADPEAEADRQGDGSPEGAGPARKPAVVLGGTQPGIWRVPADGSPASEIVTFGDDVRLSWPAADAEGKHVAFAAYDDAGYALVTLDVAGATLARHATDSVVEHPGYAPDGRHLVFTVGGRTRQEVVVMPATGGDLRALTQNSVRDRYPRFSHDGKRVWFETLDDDPNFPRARSVVVLSSVPFTP